MFVSAFDNLNSWFRSRHLSVGPLVTVGVFLFPFQELIQLAWWKSARIFLRSPQEGATDVISSVPPYQIFRRDLQVEISNPELLNFVVGFLELAFQLSAILLAVYCFKLSLSLAVFDGNRAYHSSYLRPLNALERTFEILLRAIAYIALTAMMLNYDWAISLLRGPKCVEGLEPFLALWGGVGIVVLTFLFWDFVVRPREPNQANRRGFWKGHLVLCAVSLMNVLPVAIPKLLGTYYVIGLILFAFSILLLCWGSYRCVIKGLPALMKEFGGLCVQTVDECQTVGRQ